MKTCNKCLEDCVNCDNFEIAVETETDLNILSRYKQQLLKSKFKDNNKILDNIIDWIVSKVGTYQFFIICLVVISSPLLFTKLNDAVAYFGTIIQVALPSLIMVANNRTDKERQFKSEREYRILLTSDKIDEISEMNRRNKL